MLKILHAHLLRTFVANSKIDVTYAFYPESLSDKYLAVRKIFAFSDSGLSSRGQRENEKAIQLKYKHHIRTVGLLVTCKIG